MADEIKYDSTQPVRSQASATYNPTGLSNQANLDSYNNNRMQQLQNVYNTAQQNTNAALKTAYDQNMATAQATRDKISPQYQQSQNQLAAQNEIQRRNLNMQGAANGLNTGAGSQLALGQSMAYQKNAGNLARSEQEALGAADRGIADLQMNYQNAIAQAAANNNYKLAAAMLDEYNNQYNRQMTLENQNWQRQQQLENQAYTRAYNEENRDYNRAQAQDERDYTRAYNEENRDYTRAYNEENRDYTRAYNEENRDYTRDWNQNQRDYERAYNEENRDYTRDWNQNQRDYERKYNEENRDYTRNWNEDQREHDRQLEEAQQKSNFGDFSGYEKLYGKDTADVMQLFWALQNPDAAWASGKLKAEDYVALTGKNPSQPAGDVSGYYSGVPTAATPSGSGSTGSSWLSGGSGGGYSGSRSSGGSGGSRGGYTGPAGYYDAAGNFVVPNADGSVAAAYGSALDQAGVGVHERNGVSDAAARDRAIAAAGGSSSSSSAPVTTSSSSGNTSSQPQNVLQAGLQQVKNIFNAIKGR